ERRHARPSAWQSPRGEHGRDGRPACCGGSGQLEAAHTARARSTCGQYRSALMLFAISGGAGFLGLHLSRRLLADGHQVRTLDVVPLDDSELEESVEELRGDVRDADHVRSL